MENSTYILVPSGGGQQLQIPVATSSASATAATFTKVNSGHAVVVSSVNNTHGANLPAGKSVLNMRPIGPNLASSWKPVEAAANRLTNAQTHPVRFIVAGSKDGFVNVSNFATLTSSGGTVGQAVNGAAANNNRVALVKHSSTGAVQKIAPAATVVSFSATPNNGSLRATVPGGNRVAGRTASFSNIAAAVVPKTASSGSSMWGPLSVANTTMTGSMATVTSPSKQLIIQLAPEQLVCCHCFFC